MSAGLRATLVALALLAVAPPASAHRRSVSYSTWTLEADGASVRLKLSLLDRSAVQAALDGADPAAVSAYLQSHLTLSRAGERCEPSDPRTARSLPAAKGWLRFGWAVRCPDGEGLTLRSDLLFDRLASHLHFARVVTPDGAHHQLLLSDGQRDASVDPRSDESTAPATVSWFEIGVVHILGGADHLVFLLTLLLIAVRIKEVAIAVTGFTVGHSVSLALATTGTAAPPAVIIEAVIGLTIAWVAAENVWLAGERRDRRIPIGVAAATGAAAVAAMFLGPIPARVLVGATVSLVCYFALMARSQHPERARWVVAVVFGLVHGFAFASVLGEHDLHGAELVWPLLGFNLGVEAGQLGVVLVAWPLWAGLRRVASRAPMVRVGSAAALALGVFWFVSRAF